MDYRSCVARRTRRRIDLYYLYLHKSGRLRDNAIEDSEQIGEAGEEDGGPSPCDLRSRKRFSGRDLGEREQRTETTCSTDKVEVGREKAKNLETLSSNKCSQVKENNFKASGGIIVIEDVEEEEAVPCPHDLGSKRYGGRDLSEKRPRTEANNLTENVEDRREKAKNLEVKENEIEASEELIVIEDVGEENSGPSSSNSRRKPFGGRKRKRRAETGSTENVGGFEGFNVETNLSNDRSTDDGLEQPFTARKEPPQQTASKRPLEFRFWFNEADSVKKPKSGTGLADLWAEMNFAMESTGIESSSGTSEIGEPMPVGLNQIGEPMPVMKESSEQTAHKLPLAFGLGANESESVQKPKSQTELDDLWAEMNFAIKSTQIGSAVSSDVDDEAGESEKSAIICPAANHDIVLDEEIGLICRICGHVLLEIRYVLSPMLERHTRSQFTESNQLCFEEVDSPLDGVKFPQPGNNADDLCSPVEGSVWEMLPNVRETMFPHQREAFEFIWKNLAGTIDFAKLKGLTCDKAGGCIISHAPGTGKTRLAMVFLQAYLEVFPDCRPLIVAPASILLTWENEFKKWNFRVPFYNLNSLELTEEEREAAKEKLKELRSRNPDKNSIRLLKLSLWMQSKSVLGISYSLYEKLAGEKSTNKKKVGRKNKKAERMKEILVQLPGLLVLDEGHTPRNQRSGIWKVLLNVKTEKRIILSGTPFQNNFLELCNTLCIARPSFPKKIPSSFKKLWQKGPGPAKGCGRRRKFAKVWFCSSVEKLDFQEIEELKSLMAPFVHVHKGCILQKSLPGLIDSVLVLNPPDLQRELLKIIECTRTSFEFEHKLALCSLHPSLFKDSSLSEKEVSAIRQVESELRKVKPEVESKRKPHNLLDGEDFRLSDGVKTRFLLEFIKLTQALGEKVLVFSQYIDPLKFLVEKICSFFQWSEGKEILHMHGKLEQKQRQSLINNFNDPKSEAVVLLASTRACSEGIHLVGASRVVLLDVVWNPSVERQAISRAYRLGQKRVVYTYHLMIQGTQECDKYCKQAEKNRLSELVFSSTEEDGQKTNPVTVSEDKILDEMVHHDKLKDIFRKIIYQPKESDLLESFSSLG